jgi:hypothetical protein
VIAEAIDTVLRLGWALLAWIVLMAAVAGAAVYAVVVTVAWPCETAWRAVAGAPAATRALRALPEAQAAHKAAHARLAPSWARTEHEEAA